VSTSQASSFPPSVLGLPADLQLDDLSILARTLWGEAESEGKQGQIMVANALINRVRISMEKPHWWGCTVAEVCLKPYQISSWLPNSTRRPKMMAVTEADPNYAQCLEIAREAIAGTLEDLTNGATSYLNPKTILDAGGQLPSWATEENQRAQYLHHTFYRVL
jgi:spore germination cell wall hydrolase CwlJ-like protein